MISRPDASYLKYSESERLRGCFAILVLTGRVCSSWRLDWVKCPKRGVTATRMDQQCIFNACGISSFLRGLRQRNTFHLWQRRSECRRRKIGFKAVASASSCEGAGILMEVLWDGKVGTRTVRLSSPNEVIILEVLWKQRIIYLLRIP